MGGSFSEAATLIDLQTDVLKLHRDPEKNEKCWLELQKPTLPKNSHGHVPCRRHDPRKFYFL